MKYFMTLTALLITINAQASSYRDVFSANGEEVLKETLILEAVEACDKYSTVKYEGIVNCVDKLERALDHGVSEETLKARINNK